jgi:hypothetical protein
MLIVRKKLEIFSHRMKIQHCKKYRSTSSAYQTVRNDIYLGRFPLPLSWLGDWGPSSVSSACTSYEGNPDEACLMYYGLAEQTWWSDTKRDIFRIHMHAIWNDFLRHYNCFWNKWRLSFLAILILLILLRQLAYINQIKRDFYIKEGIDKPSVDFTMGRIDKFP